MSHMKSRSYPIRVGERGRVVLPAPLRRELGVNDGDQLLLVLDDEGLRVVKASDAAAAGRGMFADDSGRSLVDELLDERRDDARRE